MTTDTACLIGCGRIGHNHAESYASTDGVELTAIADINAERLAAMGELHDVPQGRRYRDYTALLDAEDVDIISVATPCSAHYNQVMTIATSASEPAVIWCEKPIATTVREGQQMVAACEQSGAELVINHSRRFSYAYEALYDLLWDRQLLGDLRSVRLTAGPEFLNMGTHYLDLLLYLLDTTIDDVRGGCVEAVAVDETVRYSGGGILSMANGVTGYLDPFGEAPKRLYIEGTKGRLSAPLSIAADVDQEWYYWQTGENGQRPKTPPEPLTELWDEDITGTPPTAGTAAVPAQPLFNNAAGHIVDLAAGNRENAAPGTRAVHGLAGLVGLVVSEWTGSRIRLPLAHPFRGVPLSHEIPDDLQTEL